MTYVLHFHPLSSYCHKVLIALYEGDIAFEPALLNLGDPEERARFLKLSPLGKMPVLVDQQSGRVVGESSVIIEFLDGHHPQTPLVPSAPDDALQVRAQDRFFDGYVMDPMQRIVGDRIRPADRRDPYGVDGAREALRAAYDVIETWAGHRTWACGETFTLADCAAAPSLFYANLVRPFGPEHQAVSGYFERLRARPSVSRVLDEMQPYFHMFPQG